MREEHVREVLECIEEVMGANSRHIWDIWFVYPHYWRRVGEGVSRIEWDVKRSDWDGWMVVYYLHHIGFKVFDNWIN